MAATWGFTGPTTHQNAQSATGLWKLDPTAPGSDLFSGRRVLPSMVGNDVVESAAFSPDGKSIDASVVHIIFHTVRRGNVLGGFVKLSAETGRPLSTLLVQRAPTLPSTATGAIPRGIASSIAADAAANHLLLNCAHPVRPLDRGRFTRCQTQTRGYSWPWPGSRSASRRTPRR